MRKPWMYGTFLMLAVLAFAVPPNSVPAADGAIGWKNPLKLTSWFTKTRQAAYSEACDDCGEVHDSSAECIERIPIEDCVDGKMKVYDCMVKYEYVAIPEVRYRWIHKWITKKITCEYCKPVCHVEEYEDVYFTEEWDKEKLECSTLHCKSLKGQGEIARCKHCGSEPGGETFIKVRYKSCVKVPYTIYRQVKRPVCVKQPRYEKVEGVPITRYECAKCEECGDECDGEYCDECCDQDAGIRPVDGER